MKKLWKILKIIVGWIIGIFTIIFGVFSFFETDYWLPKIFAVSLTLTGLYIIPLINKKLKIKIKPLIISIIFLVSFLGIPISETSKKSDNSIDAKKYYVTANVLNVREGQGKKYKVLFKLKKGDEVYVISEDNNWAKIVISDEQTGYVASEFISDKPPKKKKGDNWLSYIVISVIILLGMFSKGDTSCTSTVSAQKQTAKPVQKKPQQIKEKTEEPVFICKYCGYTNKDLSTLTFFSCSRSPTGKHVPYEKGVQPMYYCKYCGYKNKDLGTLTFFSCSKSPTGKHEPL